MRRLLCLMIILVGLAACSPAVNDGPAATEVVAGPTEATQPAATAEPRVTREPATAVMGTPGGDTTAGDQAEPEAVPGEPVIVFERGGGIAGVSEQWTIYASGQVESAEGALFSVAATQVDQAVDQIEALGFFDMAEVYGRNSQCADCFQYAITVVSDGQSHTVHTIDAAADAPPELGQVIETINGLITAAQSR